MLVFCNQAKIHVTTHQKIGGVGPVRLYLNPPLLFIATILLVLKKSLHLIAGVRVHKY